MTKRKPPSAEKLVEHCLDNHRSTGTVAYPRHVVVGHDGAHASVCVCDLQLCRALANAFVVEITGHEGVYLSFVDARAQAETAAS